MNIMRYVSGAIAGSGVAFIVHGADWPFWVVGALMVAHGLIGMDLFK